MSVESSPTPSSKPLKESFADEVAQIQTIWQELPDAHQVALVLQLADTIMTNSYRPYLRHAMAQQWPLKPEEFPVAFPRFEIAESDLIRANLDEEEAIQFTPTQRKAIAETMRSHYIHDLFWPELRHVAGLFMNNLEKEGESG